MELHEEILELLRKHMAEDTRYINPHFMQTLSSAIEIYYGIEDDAVDDWIVGMYEE